MICFTIPGAPKGKGRPRFSRRGNRVVTYTPDGTVNYENLVRWCWKEQSGRTFPKDTPLHITIRGYFPIPKSVSKKKHAEMLGAPHTKKCDCDNLAKAVIDALNQFAFYDDAEVCELTVTKQYDDNPRVEVEICKVNTEQERIMNHESTETQGNLFGAK